MEKQYTFSLPKVDLEKEYGAKINKLPLAEQEILRGLMERFESDVITPLYTVEMRGGKYIPTSLGANEELKSDPVSYIIGQVRPSKPDDWNSTTACGGTKSTATNSRWPRGTEGYWNAYAWNAANAKITLVEQAPDVIGITFKNGIKGLTDRSRKVVSPKATEIIARMAERYLDSLRVKNAVKEFEKGFDGAGRWGVPNEAWIALDRPERKPVSNEVRLVLAHPEKAVKAPEAQ
jgi:hypothetical protein